MKPASPISEDDLYLWNEGTHYRLYEKLGAHPTTEGTHFAVWAPNAELVSVVGDWNSWDGQADEMAPRGVSGIWEIFLAEAKPGHGYKFRIRNGDYAVDKADPFGVHHETPPRTASKIWDLDYEWGDTEWMSRRGERNRLSAPMSVYEVHLGSWRRGEGGRHLTYGELAEQLPDHVSQLGFTHVEILPVMEHPFYGSWGYQTTGYFAPTSRYGTPQDFMALVDALHRAGIGVILDWVPSHFPDDAHGLGYFDGTHLFEHSDPRLGFHPDWESLIFNYGRTEVPSFLISSALFWLDRYHADGLRVDAVASMLYLDYSRDDGEWIPNVHGGRENLEAIAFLKSLNETVYLNYPDVQTFAEESTAWPMVSKPTSSGGLGFGLKWDMGWMHDTLQYMSREPVHRQFHHSELTFRGVYAFTENFILPLSHDEVVPGKGSLLNKMPGDDWQQFANLRLLLTYMYAQPGKKLIFMGAELAQRLEWDHEGQLDWDVTGHRSHEGITRLLRDLNRLLVSEPALHELDSEPAGFEWLVADDDDNSGLAFLRLSAGGERVVAAFNLTPVPRDGYRIGVPGGSWEVALNTDSDSYWGSGSGSTGPVSIDDSGSHGQPFSLTVDLPPLGALLLREATREEE
jgi:1,4-alpha-glucan branching enzyme